MSIEWNSLEQISVMSYPLSPRIRDNPCLGLLTFFAAPALATAKETPRIALAPSFPLLGVPSRLFKNLSTAFWSVTSNFPSMRAGPMISLT